ncbi:MAG TPA: TldD/PmbA family protein, partial [Thermoprotei archaeon]|nr:TldD/PmbA family protein [Thermoprotei archaeon]
MEDLLQYAVDYALKLGAVYAEARYQRDLSDHVSLVNGVPLSMSYSSSAGVSIRVFTRKGVGFSATNTLTKDSIRDSVEKAYREAAISEKMRKNEIKLSGEEAYRVSYMLYVKENPADISLEEKLK